MRALVAVLALSGCAVSPPRVETVETKVPVPVTCVDEVPARPPEVAFDREAERRVLGPVPVESRAQALDLQRRLLRAFALELEAALTKCRR